MTKDPRELLAWVADIFETPVESLQPQTPRDEIETWDSLGILTLIARMDEDFHILLTDEEIQRLRSVGDVIDLIRERERGPRLLRPCVSCSSTAFSTLEPGRCIEAEHFFSAELDFFQDHFPGFPVVPGVLLTEMMGQAAAKCLDAEGREKERGKAILAQIRSASFRDWVRPDERALIRAEIRTNRPEYATAAVRRKSGGAGSARPSFSSPFCLSIALPWAIVTRSWNPTWPPGGRERTSPMDKMFTLTGKTFLIAGGTRGHRAGDFPAVRPLRGPCRRQLCQG